MFCSELYYVFIFLFKFHKIAFLFLEFVFPFNIICPTHPHLSKASNPNDSDSFAPILGVPVSQRGVHRDPWAWFQFLLMKMTMTMMTTILRTTMMMMRGGNACTEDWSCCLQWEAFRNANDEPLPDIWMRDMDEGFGWIIWMRYLDEIFGWDISKSSLVERVWWSLRISGNRK